MSNQPTIRQTAEAAFETGSLTAFSLAGCFRGASGLGAEAPVARASGEPAEELREMIAKTPPVSQFLAEALTAGNATSEADTFDALPSATKTAAVRQALAHAPARAADATAF